jgi:membrane protein DedA with SNARE-associated domain
MFLENIIFFIPSEVVMPLAGWMLVKDRGLGWEWLILAGLLGALGSTIGAWFFYYLGAWGGRPLLLRYGRYFLIARDEVDAADRWFEKWGALAVFVSRMIPLARTFISIPAGVSRMPIVPFTLYTFAGSFIWAFALAVAGYQLGESWEDLRSWMGPTDIIALIALLAFVAWYVYRHIKREFRTEAEPASQDG